MRCALFANFFIFHIFYAHRSPSFPLCLTGGMFCDHASAVPLCFISFIAKDHVHATFLGLASFCTEGPDFKKSPSFDFRLRHTLLILLSMLSSPFLHLGNPWVSMPAGAGEKCMEFQKCCKYECLKHRSSQLCGRFECVWLFHCFVTSDTTHRSTWLLLYSGEKCTEFQKWHKYERLKH